MRSVCYSATLRGNSQGLRTTRTQNSNSRHGCLGCRRLAWAVRSIGIGQYQFKWSLFRASQWRLRVFPFATDQPLARCGIGQLPSSPPTSWHLVGIELGYGRNSQVPDDLLAPFPRLTNSFKDPRSHSVLVSFGNHLADRGRELNHFKCIDPWSGS